MERVNTTAILTNLFFFGAVLISHFSGNDKAPYFVVGAAGISVVIAAGFLLKRQWKAAILIAIPIFYTGVVIILAREGLIDSQAFLGFR